MDNLLYQYWFMNNEDVSYSKKYKLVEYFYDSYNLYFASKTELLNSKLLDEVTIDRFIYNRKNYNFEKEFDDFKRSPFNFVTIENPNYPDKLRNIYDKPYGLYYIGEMPDFNRAVSIVGARRCSAYGKRLAQDIGKKLGENGYTVISGMARGIDTYGHRGCLDGNGNTVAVLGSGCDVIYPKDNRLLYEEIVSTKGAIISEYQMGTAPLPLNFPRRNRIVSALSDAVVVIEAKEKSGSLITADFALEHGKDIYVVPGRVGDSLSLGTNKLISQGAGIIYDTDSFINELNSIYGVSTSAHKKTNKTKTELTKEQKEVYGYFDEYPKSIATVLETCKMDYIKLLSVILSLEKEGLLAEVFKNNYVKTI